MKILVVTQYFWPESFRINDLVVGLVNSGHEVTVLTGIPNYPKGNYYKGYGVFRNLKQDYNGAKIVRVPLIPRGKGSGIRLALNYLSFACIASLFAPFVCRGKFDNIFVYEPSPVTVGLPAIVLKKIKAIPICFWVQDLWPESLSATGAVNNKRILNAINWLVRFIYNRCDILLVQSPAFTSFIERQGVDREKIIYFPNSVEEIYKPYKAKEDIIEHELPKGFRLIFAGNIGVAQDFETILLAAEKIKIYPDIQLIILGDGRKSKWVRRQVELRGLSKTVHLLGRHPVEAMNGFFAQAEALLVTLKRDPAFSTTIPSKIQSYMASGKPIIAGLDGEGARIILEAGAGLTSPAEDANELASSILSMYRLTPEQRADMGRCGLKYCEENFDRVMLIGKLEELLENMKRTSVVTTC